ncbi:MAG TPA: GDP-mannose 4,6-dehydratase [Oscillospiraceae bacterium]|jgi:GDP-4-dehydro-6-deoxy-D-mannose reductase|nr:GDP-D-mannose dehydratase [Oscillospiraceae bacterium]HOV40413.1 GDP-mannose 4,6-dehydratase [Oscillospiraceae bacterium]
MRALVVGAGGFAGHYLLKELESSGAEVFATKLEGERIDNPGAEVSNLDITDMEAVFSLFGKIRPDCVYHLAAQSSAALSWKKPQLTMNVNVIGAINVLEAVREINSKARVLLIGSGEEYGNVLGEEIPIKESNPVRPANIYAVSKLAQNLVGGLYFKAYGTDIISVRAFNHIGPMQAQTFVASDFCRQAAMIEKGLKEPVIYVGNLSAVRDFTDVRDVVRAYRLLMEKGVSGKTYNVGGGTVCSIEELLDRILKLSGAKIRVEVDKEKLRPIDTPKICADISEIKKDTGWIPVIDLDKTLSDTLDFWRKTC